MPSRLNPGQGTGSQLQNNMRSDIIIETVRHMRKRDPTSEYVYVQLYGMSEEVRRVSISIYSDNISVL